jgi:torulene dioxygenase
MSMFTPAGKSNEGINNIGVTLSANLPGVAPLTSSDINNTATKPKNHASGIASLWAKTDTSTMKRLDPETLEPIGIARQTKLHPSLRGVMSGAHAKSDPTTGDVFNYNLEFGRRPTYRVFRVNAATGTTDVLATLTADAAYIHSIFLTANHVVLCVWNGFIGGNGARILWERNVLDALQPFDATRPARWFVVDRRHDQGVVATFESDPFFAFHSINAWEEPNAADPEKIDIVADLSAYADLSVLKRFYYENLMSTAPGAPAYHGEKAANARAALRRYRLPSIPSSSSSATSAPPNTSTLTTPPPQLAIREYLIPTTTSLELATINPVYICRPHRYTYGICDRGLSTFADGLGKFDSVTKTTVFWSVHGQSPGEPIFVRDPHTKEGEEDSEDNGVLLTVVLDGVRGGSYLLCLDAKTMTEVGRAEVGGVVGFGFHGTFVSSGGECTQY